MSVTIVQVDDTQQQGFIQKFSLAEQIFFEDGEEQFGATTFLDLMLPAHELGSFFTKDTCSTGFVSVVIGAPFVDRQLMILLLLNGLSDIASN